MIDAIHQVTRRRVPVELLARRAGDPPVLYADTARARQTLGFRPSLSDIETIIRTAAPGFGLEVRS
ncbi:UDP-glucose 4-epimerase [compost metagenome]